MDERLYWLWLQYALGFSGKTKALIDKYHSAKAFYDLGTDEWAAYFKRSKRCFERANEKSPEDFCDNVEFCDKHSLHIITPDSVYYPQNLLDLEDYPALLYVRGDYTCLNFGVPFGVIGTRTPSTYGAECAKGIVSVLCENEALVISGGAVGIDSVAHKTAIHCHGKTVLVLGCGHGYNYLPENAAMRKEVAKNGALISEYPPFTPVERFTFPMRNRIISGMSRAVVIIEAAEKSGTFSTARHAAQQGRKLFVLPGDINSGKFTGSNKLISEGATAIFSGNDILNKCDLLSKTTTTVHIKSDEVFPKLDEDADANITFDDRRLVCEDEENLEGQEETKTEKAEKSPSEKTKKSKKTAKVKNTEKPKEDKDEEKKEKIEIIPKKPPEGISKNAEIVYNIMSSGINELDEITRKSSLQIRHVLVALTELEMLGVAKSDGPNMYRLN